jgi:hypothetical protein
VKKALKLNNRNRPNVIFKQRITIEVTGESYTGIYWLDNDLLTVKVFGPDITLCQKSALLDGLPPKSLALVLLREMVEAGSVEPDC